MSWQEKNIAVGLAGLFVLKVMAHLTFGSGPSGAAGSLEAPATEPVVTEPVAQDLARPEPPGASGTGAEEPDRGQPRSGTGGPQEPVSPPWWRRVFGG